MSLFMTLELNIYKFFASTQWTSEGISAFPDNFSSVNLPSEYVKIDILAGSRGLNRNSVSGILKLTIHTEMNIGPNRDTVIADKLSSLLGNKSETNSGWTTQLFAPTHSVIGLLRDSKYWMTKLEIPFNHSGVS